MGAKQGLDAQSLDAQALAAALRDAMAGDVWFDQGNRAIYSTDASNYRRVPIGVVAPRSVDDAVAAVAICREFGAPITCRGGGTSLAGQACNVAVVFDFSRHMHRVLEIDPERRLARVEPGCGLDTLRRQAQQHGLTFGPDPATHDRNTLGGMIGNNSCGVHSVQAEFYGPGPRTQHNVESLEVLTWRGLRLQVGATSDAELARILAAGDERAEVYRDLVALRDQCAAQVRARYPDIPRRVSGYNLEELLPEREFHVARALVGSEGTCVLVLEATLRLIPHRPRRALVVLGYPDVCAVGDHIAEIRAHRPVGLEGIDDNLVRAMGRKGVHEEGVARLPEGGGWLPEGGGWLLVEFGAETQADADDQARRFQQAILRADRPPSVELVTDRSRQQQIWEVRESGLGATANVPGQPNTHPGWEDAAVPPEAIGGYLREFRALLRRYGYHAALYGHFGQGCVHCRIDFDFSTRAGIDRWLRFLDDAADLVVRHGGSLSGEHGDGQARGALLEKMFGPELVGHMRAFKRIWDPDGRMNPGKGVDAGPPDHDLRLGTDYAPWTARTHFAYEEDKGSFARAVGRCVGVGLCRREDGGVMCPSYMVTREEKHSTRGRARLLFEMMHGGLVRERWRSEAVLEALDLCLGCKGCRSDCPVNVDMANYKAEFLAHHYRGRLRPRAAYSMGLIHRWAPLGALAPGLVNWLGRTEPFARMLKWLAGIAPQRTMPAFAPQTFRAWFDHHRPAARAGSRRVLLWPDTFNDHFHPTVARAACEVLTRCGFDVDVPRARLCCGRPLYDWGMLATARREWQRTLRVLREDIAAGTPVIGLEPSCVAAFRDELPGLFPHDLDARRLSRQTFLLDEFLEAERVPLPALPRRALVHAHCHHRAVMTLDAQTALLDRLGLDHELLDSGCCGMAGAFGFDARHYQVAMACGERVLLPAVRQAPADTLIVTNGFSCREQIEQGTGRRALHLAEVLQMAIDAPETRM